MTSNGLGIYVIGIVGGNNPSEEFLSGMGKTTHVLNLLEKSDGPGAITISSSIDHVPVSESNTDRQEKKLARMARKLERNRR